MNTGAMTKSFTFGVVGGSGSTGTVVVSELHKSSDAEIVIGARDATRASAIAAEIGGKVSASRLDVLDSRSLDEFCSRCSIVINCAGPVMLLQGRVAQSALRNRCHYIDLAGVTFVKERMLPHGQEIADAGLSFVVSAGWMPGITELLPAYANAQARTKLDSVESLTIYFGDGGDWSANALRDGVWFIHKEGLRSPGYFHKGEWVRAKMSAASRKINLGGPVGPGQFSLFSTPEMNEIGRQLKDCDVFIYTYLSGLRTILAATLMAVMPLPDSLSVRMLRNVFRRNRLPVEGFVTAHVVGRSQGVKHRFTAQIVFDKHRGYWVNGVVPAAVARLLSTRADVKPGVHYLSDAVDPIAFMPALRTAGITQTESFEPCE